MTLHRLLPLALLAGLASCGASHGTPNGGPGRSDGGIVAGTDPNIDYDGDGYTTNQGDCNDTNPNVHPGADEICNGLDDNCNGKVDEVCDVDGDGYTPDSGDCNDHENLVNPGAYEVVDNHVDDNCDGRVDEATPPCDGSSAGDGTSLAGNLELCAPWMTAAVVKGDPKARGVFASYGVIKPQMGAGFVVLSTGIAAAEKDAAFVEPDPGTDFVNVSDEPNPAPMNTKNNVCGVDTADAMTVHDYVELKLTLKVPTNAQSFSFHFNFLSAEYPEYVGSTYNDKFLAILDSKSFKGNVAFDKKKNPITVNVGFFTTCDSAPICNDTKTNSCRVNSLPDLNGTGYELDNGMGIPIGGGTGWLTTTAPVTPGETATLRFIIFDESDHILDSAVLLDGFQWQLQGAAGPTTIQ